MYLISCDPGISGAIAIFENNKLIDCVNIKKTKDINAKTIIDFHRTVLLLSNFPDATFVCEQLWAQNRSSNNKGGRIDTPVTAFSLGRSYGCLLLAAEQAGLKVRTVAPSKWKRDMGFGKDKLEPAIEMHSRYPEILPKTRSGNLNDNKGDAIAIGEWWIAHGKSQHEEELAKEARRAERLKAKKAKERAEKKKQKATENTVPTKTKKTKEQ
ncbi:hypothetical protein AB3A32_002626 [Vibrio alginolyticus]